ncbi:DUF2796 domain-containing protein, partial [Vibrio renipiscarius]|uniref:ZrgA family zinc uptake protein n=1 Tax=Vibrio renipiscarius TaxID=1461322 RepID=UPI003552E008
MNKFSPIALALGFVVTHSAVAEDGFRQHDAHVHGEVEFNIAQDANELLFEITAPGADVVGFEHAPETEGQTQTLKNAVAQLSKPNDVMMISAAAQCEVKHVSVRHSLGDNEHHDHDHD